jgi:hypothetical protein
MLDALRSDPEYAELAEGDATIAAMAVLLTIKNDGNNGTVVAGGIPELLSMVLWEYESREYESLSVPQEREREFHERIAARMRERFAEPARDAS